MNRHNSFNQIFWGLAIIIVGLLFLAQNLGLMDTFPFWNFLPALLVILGIYQLFINRFRAWVGPVIMILVGLYLLMATLDFISWSTFGTLIWPSVLILIGLSIIFRQGGVTGQHKEFSEETNSQFSVFSAFSGQKRRLTSVDFQSGEATAMFGATEIDLREAKVTNPPARIQTTAMFGGVEIYVPEDWDVRMDVVAFFGGCDDKRRNVIGPKATPDLIISGTVMFGGLDIK
jgi:predicted membrane protein